MAEIPEEAPQGGLGGMITEKITDTIKNMDVMTVLKKMVATKPDDEESEEIRQKLEGVIQQFNSMSENERQAFTEKIKEGLTSRIQAKLNDPNNLNLGNLEQELADAVFGRLYMVGFAILVFIVLLVFFGYKLYKSIKEKELKKEEKKKAKQMKKKK